MSRSIKIWNRKWELGSSLNNDNDLPERSESSLILSIWNANQTPTKSPISVEQNDNSLNQIFFSKLLNTTTALYSRIWEVKIYGIDHLKQKTRIYRPISRYISAACTSAFRAHFSEMSEYVTYSGLIERILEQSFSQRPPRDCLSTSWN